MKCSLCDNEALAGLGSDIGPLCKLHAYGHMGMPLGEAQEEASCRKCRRLVNLFNAAYLEGSGFWHSSCLDSYYRDQKKCPKHGSDPSTCGCWGDPIVRLVEQASADAQSIWQSGGRHDLCSVCLRFNTATSMGLPLIPQDPQRADTVCGSCFKPVCWKHTGNPPRDNILGLSPDEVYCSGGWVSNCYDDLAEKVACSFEDCETTRSSFRGDEHWDPIVDSSQCDKCDNFYCDYVSGHEQCPECSGIQCDDCNELFDEESLSAYQEDCYTIRDICSSCLETQEMEDEESAFGDYFISDFRDKIRDKFAVINLDLDISDVDDELIEELIRKGMDECGLYIEHHSEGPHLDMVQLVECVDPYALVSLPGSDIDGLPAGPNAVMTSRANRGLRHLKDLFDMGTNASYMRAANMRRSRGHKPKKSSLKKIRRASLRGHMRRAMKRPGLFVDRKDARVRAMKRASKSIKGMRPFLEIMHPDVRSRMSMALRKERRHKPRSGRHSKFLY